ncbi:phage integrase Arm DNA-binding domain-containing protein [Paraburkholderia sp. HD33-4]|uniref:phage integrase Arm DNA-binding domain-containing protein n=1 Tax=Paraburkholderia sp. HD33-4 TaxID=2883242 RepID=UPI001F2071A7|nr:phage integrase Arm DNA-binding domain-containing protein [Paraburkholderia sp. HD33-4]
MSPRPRIRKRANWPANLHEPRAGYYTWRDPRDGKTHVLGRMPLAQAIHEAQEANLVVEGGTIARTLAERVAQEQHTVADLLKKMPVKGAASTIRGRKYHDAHIAKCIGSVPCADLTTKHIADILEALIDAGKAPYARTIRTRLVAVCKRGAALGWITNGNPAANTEQERITVKRRRLRGIEEFNAIFEKAPEVCDWLQNAMLLALVSGQDRSTVARWERSSVKDGIATAFRRKTKVYVEIPTALRMDALGMSLAEVIARCKSTGVVSKYLIHHVRNKGGAKSGQPVKIDSLSRTFMEARELAGITGDDAPSFHEIRSLAKRLYEKQGGVDTKALLGHMTETAADLYADSRGIEPIRVKISA